MFNTPSVLARFESTGIISKQIACDLGIVGPAARAYGCEIDTRMNYSSVMYRSTILQFQRLTQVMYMQVH